ncbi:hypothetical protein SAMN04515647_2407 [Cohaesibacter sp. ES.047]|uniref:hypothetical protein n=1 Tax=Cohaesibacter sp. ES.047 TaxID=1798205 RepID=UPI000BB760FF|nr:hypothetical protein [Cohaesibacter sp. ES.047]SNY92162.1 hypothetical protein SAMN04515647_2407 [Cohaesibacter sp. ES.047]
MTTTHEATELNDNEASAIVLRPLSQSLPASADEASFYLEEKMLTTVNRAISVVSDETSALRSKLVVDLKPYSDAKSRALLDLNRVMSDIDMRDVPTSVVNELRLLREVLDDNERLLAQHLEAVREITDLLSATMIKAESDGTYSSSPAQHLEAK